LAVVFFLPIIRIPEMIETSYRTTQDVRRNDRMFNKNEIAIWVLVGALATAFLNLGDCSNMGAN